MPSKTAIEVSLALDVGGQGCRYGLFTNTGEILRQRQHPYETYYPAANQVEHQIDDINKAIDSLLQDVGHYLAQQSNVILKSIGLACQGATLLCWNKNNLDALSPVLSWQDTRGDQILTSSSLSVTDIRAITGFTPSPHYGASKYSWCLQHIQDVIKQQKELMMGPLASYLSQRLTASQHAVTNPSHAARTLLWDTSQNNYSEQLLSVFNISRETLPVPCNNRYKFGKLLMKSHGISAPLTQVNRDQSASLFNQGKPGTKDCYINMGTGIFIQRLITDDNILQTFLERDIGKQTGLQISPCYRDESMCMYSLEASVHSGLAVKKELESHTQQSLTREIIIAALNTFNDQSSSTPWGLITASGLGSPYWRDDVSSQVPTQMDTNTAIVIWIRSILYLVRQNIDLLDNYMAQAERIIISGGLSQYDHLCQILANLCQRPIVRYHDHHATLRGTAFLCAGLPDTWKQSSAETFNPKQTNDAAYFSWLVTLYKNIKQHNKPMVMVSHRGDINREPENSIAAICAAHVSDLNHIEFDIQIDKAGIPVLLHDQDLSRMQNIKRSIFDTDSQHVPQLENLWQLLDALKSLENLHLFIEVKHDSIEHWGINAVLDAIAPLLASKQKYTYTLLARSTDFLAQARKQGHLSIGVNVRSYQQSDYYQLLTLAPDFLVINHERIPENSSLWPGPWEWMIYEVSTIDHARQLLDIGGRYMISFNATQLQQRACNDA